MQVEMKVVRHSRTDMAQSTIVQASLNGFSQDVNERTEVFEEVFIVRRRIPRLAHGCWEHGTKIRWSLNSILLAVIEPTRPKRLVRSPSASTWKAPVAYVYLKRCILTPGASRAEARIPGWDDKVSPKGSI